MVFSKKQLHNFWNKVEKTDGCWNWIGYTANGYGRFNVKNKTYLSHKIVLIIEGFDLLPYKKEKGAAGIIVMHTCDNRKCVNPSHLKMTSQKENMQDAKIKGRKWNGETSGEKNPKAKLTWNDVNLIRTPDFTVADFKEKFSNLNKSQFYYIKNFKSWIPAY